MNVVKFDYLLAISRPHPKNLTHSIVEAFAANAFRLYALGARINDDCHQDAAILAIMGLLVLHAHQVDDVWDWEDLSQRNMANSRLLLQAGLFCQHVASKEKGKQNRPLLLLSTRLHIQLGFASIAFALYRQVGIKEILQDTLSHHFLARISQIHPHDVKGPKGFSPDDELSKVISTIKRMESKVDDFLYLGMQDFQYDQAIEMLDFKRHLKSSLTKHLCLIERRRIARLKSVAVDSSLDLPMEGKLIRTIL